MRDTHHRPTSVGGRHASRRHVSMTPRDRERRPGPHVGVAPVPATGLRGMLHALERWLRGAPGSRLDSAHTIARLKSV